MKRTPSDESESVIALAELLKLKESGQFPGDPVNIEGTQIRSVSHTISQSVFSKLLHSYRVNVETPKNILGEFSEELSFFICKRFCFITST